MRNTMVIITLGRNILSDNVALNITGIHEVFVCELKSNIFNTSIFLSGILEREQIMALIEFLIDELKKEKQMKTKTPNPMNKREVKNEKKAFKDTEMTVKPVAKDTNKTRRKMKTPMVKKK